MEGKIKINSQLQILKETCDLLETKVYWDIKKHITEKVYFSKELFFIKILPSSTKYKKIINIINLFSFKKKALLLFRRIKMQY
jgi:hypothetical protein